jgi:hypothetical protein
MRPFEQGKLRSHSLLRPQATSWQRWQPASSMSMEHAPMTSQLSAPRNGQRSRSQSMDPPPELALLALDAPGPLPSSAASITAMAPPRANQPRREQTTLELHGAQAWHHFAI